MKKTKKIFSAILAVTMSAAVMPAAVMASDEPSTENIYKIFDLSSMYTTSNLYSSNKSYTGGSAGYAGAWYYNDFISDKYISWDTPWTDEMTENTLTSSGVKFKLRVVDGNGQNCVVRNRSDSKFYTSFDVEDLAYNSLEILVNTDRPTNTTKKVGIKLNYEDGTESVVEYKLALFTNGFGEQDKGIKATRCRTAGDLPEAYLGHFTINTDPTKELISFDVINDRFDFSVDDAGEYIIENGKYKTEKCKLSEKDNDRGAYTHVNSIYAVTMVTSEATIEAGKAAKIAKRVSAIDSAIKAMGNVDDLQYSQKADLDKITDMIAEAKDDGISDITSRLSNYDTYLAMLDKMEILFRDEIYKDIYNMIAALGDIDSLVYSQKDDVDAIGEKIKLTVENGYEVNSETVSNYENYIAAKAKIKELYAEIVLGEINDKITALGDVSDLKYSDKNKIDEITDMIDAAEDEGITVNDETLSGYADYLKACEIVKNQEPTSVPVDISSLYNTTNIYGPAGSSVVGNAGYAARIIYSSMVNDLEWKNTWDDEMTDNTVTVNGNKYALRVLDYSKNSANCTFKNNTQTEKFTNIDVEDGHYMSVNILANSERTISSTNTAKLGVKLNYSDGTCDISDMALSYFCNGYGDGANGGIKVRRMNSAMDNETYGYIGSFEIPADYSKVLTSIDIMNDCYTFETDDKGNYIFDENGQPKTGIGATDRGSAPHRAMIYAVSVTIPYETYLKDIKQEAAELEKSLESRYDISSGVLSDTAAEQFYTLREYIDEIGGGFADGFSNFNRLNAVIPRAKDAKLTENNDVLTFTVEFTVNMTDMTDYITVKQGDTVIEDAVIITNGRFVTVIINNTYNYDEQYTVAVSRRAYADGKEAYKTGEAKKFDFETNAGLVISSAKKTEASGKLTVSAKAENKGASPITVFAFAVAYDADGVPIAAAVASETINAGKYKNVSASLAVGDKTVDSVKIMWLDGIGSMNTLFATSVIE